MTAWVAIILFVASLACLVWLLWSVQRGDYFVEASELYAPRWEWRAFGWLLEKGDILSGLLGPVAFAVPIALGLVGKIYRTRLPLLLFSLSCIAGAVLAVVLNISLTGVSTATEALLYNVCDPATVPGCAAPADNGERMLWMDALRESFLLNATKFFVGALLLTLGLTPTSRKKLGDTWEAARDMGSNVIRKVRGNS